MSNTALVTGGTGFIGSAVVSQLLAEGWSVRVLARTQEAAAAASAAGAEPVRGHLLDLPSLRQAAMGCDLIFHVAGLNTLCLDNPRPLYTINVNGSVNVVQAAAAAGARRLVYTSSAATLGEPRGTVGDESSAHRGSFLSNYEHSKWEAERRVFSASARLGLDVVTLNPASVQGPGRVHGTARWLIALARGRLHFAVHTRVSLLDIADCARAHVLAAERGRSGQRYVLSGSTLAVEDLCQLIGGITGRRYRLHYVPGWLALTGASMVHGGYQFMGRRSPVCRESVRTLLHGHSYDGGLAARELGFSYTPIEQTLERTLGWYAARQMVPAPNVTVQDEPATPEA